MDYLLKYKYAFHILRVGMAITFIWIGVLILRSPEAWGGMVQPWVLDLLPFSLKEAMISTAILDIVIGLMLLVNIYVWLAALVGSLHLASVLVVVGIDVITVRDIGLLSATLALMISSWPKNFLLRFRKQKAENGNL